jgi:hypothetical protein
VSAGWVFAGCIALADAAMLMSVVIQAAQMAGAMRNTPWRMLRS